MSELLISRERVNGFRLASQVLSPRGEDPREVLRAAGWMPSRESAYLALACRMNEFVAEDLHRLIFVERTHLELSTVRGQSFIVPREMVGAALRCPSPSLRDSAERTLRGAGVADDVRDRLKERVVETISTGPLTHANLVEWFSRGEGEASRLLATPGVLTAILSLLRLDGRVARTNPSRSLLKGQAVHALAEDLLDDPPAEMAPQDALRILCAYYFRVHGPATRADFGWWCGASPTDVQDAFNAIQRTLVSVELEGLPYKYWLPASRREDLVEHERTGVEALTLVPFRDPWLSSHEGLTGRFVRPQDLNRAIPGPALPAVLVGGIVIGRWELSTETYEVHFTWYRPPGEGIEERAQLRAEEIAAFARRDLTELSPLSAGGPDGEVPVYT